MILLMILLILCDVSMILLMIVRDVRYGVRERDAVRARRREQQQRDHSLAPLLRSFARCLTAIAIACLRFCLSE